MMVKLLKSQSETNITNHADAPIYLIYLKLAIELHFKLSLKLKEKILHRKDGPLTNFILVLSSE